MSSVLAKTIALEVGLFLVLITWLCVRLSLRHRRERRRPTAFAEHSGKPLDLSTIKPRLDHVRQDYVGVAHSKPSDAGYHQTLLFGARQQLLQMAFFRNARAGRTVPGEDEMHEQS
jgi:hypothetical protein